ncbi:MAG: HAMP domain-containing histidine kinase [Scytolyngbya sp. HA4215-MV1]|jgi:signal transduction histidine kinase|nr:HAMP domain-containing histidine kinase [Scytolyngbya sp. HA4215-MV1]
MIREGSNQALSLESNLGELRLYQFQADLSCLGIEVAQVFEHHAGVPGVVLADQGKFVGMVSRHRLLECLIRPHGMELFLQKPLRVLQSYARREWLILPIATSILTAAQVALRRSPEQRGEPIVVQVDADTYLLLDFHELNVASWQLRGIETQVRYERAQVQMIQSDKMGSLGRLVDGLAHEILDPVSFIWGNLSHVSAYSDSLIQLLNAYEALLPEPAQAIADLKTAIEFDFLRQDMPEAIASIQLGAERLKKLATSLQTFCHIDAVHPKPADLHECLDSILRLLKSRLSSEIEIIRRYAPLPPVTCYIGQLSQVFMNILSNAVDALLNQSVSQQIASEFPAKPGMAPALSASSKPRIEITTRIFSQSAADASGVDSRWVSICIADNGPGLSPAVQQQILESFSIEKRAMKETSLAVSYQIVTAKHGGQLQLRSHPGIGTEFEIWLPLA